VRVLLPGPDGLEGVLREAHARYGLPMAVTEVHNGCTREEQMRWLLEAWRTAERLRDEGIAASRGDRLVAAGRL
jgi:dTDP-4-dehydrorhamnose reductase